MTSPPRPQGPHQKDLYESPGHPETLVMRVDFQIGKPGLPMDIRDRIAVFSLASDRVAKACQGTYSTLRAGRDAPEPPA